MVQPLGKTGFLKSKTYSLPYDPAIKLLGIYPREMETCPCKNLHMDIYGSFIRYCHNLERTKMSFTRWMHKLCYIQTMGIIQHRKEMSHQAMKSHRGNLNADTKWKKPVWKGYTLWFHLYNIRGQADHWDSKRPVVARGGMTRQSTEGF